MQGGVDTYDIVHHGGHAVRRTTPFVFVGLWCVWCVWCVMCVVCVVCDVCDVCVVCVVCVVCDVEFHKPMWGFCRMNARGAAYGLMELQRKRTGITRCTNREHASCFKSRGAAYLARSTILEDLEGRVPSNLVLPSDFLLHGGVNFAQLGSAFEAGGCRFVLRRESLAVPTPWRVEFNKPVLAGNNRGIEVAVSQDVHVRPFFQRGRAFRSLARVIRRCIAAAGRVLCSLDRVLSRPCEPTQQQQNRTSSQRQYTQRV